MSKGNRRCLGLRTTDQDKSHGIEREEKRRCGALLEECAEERFGGAPHNELEKTSECKEEGLGGAKHPKAQKCVSNMIWHLRPNLLD